MPHLGLLVFTKKYWGYLPIVEDADHTATRDQIPAPLARSTIAVSPERWEAIEAGVPPTWALIHDELVVIVDLGMRHDESGRSMLWTVLDRNSREAWQSDGECHNIRKTFRERDRSKIKTFKDFRTLQLFRDGGVACSQAIASWRTAIRCPWKLRQWMEHRVAYVPPLPSAPLPQLPNDAGSSSGSGGWGSTPAWGSDNGDWTAGEGWGAVGSWNIIPQKCWDGPRMPKSKGKARRQRRRKAAARAEFLRQIEETRHQAEVEWWREWERAMNLNPTPACC
ncbi:hypothetical protein C8R45DRAFT_920651 [Mycena sanguinolenta]|nr:hypothetical protein C8R45DRAFT_920651 [Mycena sanguinolenta]